MKPKPTAINKITRPTLPKVFPRTRLFRLLDRARDCPITWISGPPGSGKTTVIASYLDKRRLPCLWYRMDEGDQDLATFFYYLGLAGQKANPRHKKPLPLLTPEYQFGIPTFTRRYFENLYQRLPTPCVLVFDNYQTVPESAPVHEILCAGFSETPPGIRIIIVSRGNPDPAFASFQANSLLRTVDWEELRLTVPELKGIVKLHDRHPMSRDTLQYLHERTQGWTAGVVLLEKAGKEVFGPSIFEDHVPEAVFDYFAGEIFRHMDAEMQSFLLKTACFPRMTPGMAEELTGNEKAARILAELNRKNYFVEKRTKPDLSFQYHALFRDFLLSRHGQYLSDATSNHSSDAAAKLLEHAGLYEEAAALYIRRQTWPHLAALILKQAPSMIKQGRHRPLQEWLDRLPAEFMRSDPCLLYWKGMSLLHFTPLAAKPFFEQAFERFEAAHDTLGSIGAGSGAVHAIILGYDDFAPLDHWYERLNGLAAKIEDFGDKELEASLLAAMVTAIEFREIVHPDADRWRQRAIDFVETPETRSMKGVAVSYVLWSHLFLARRIGAARLFPLLQDITRSRDADPVSAVWGLSMTTLHEVYEIKYQQALHTAVKGLELAERVGLHFNDMLYYNNIASSYVDRLDCEHAEQWLDKIVPRLDQMPRYWRSLCSFQLARTAMARGEAALALHYCEKAYELAEKVGSKYAIACNQLLLARVYSTLGRDEESARMLDLGFAYASQSCNHVNGALALLYQAHRGFSDGKQSEGTSLLRQALGRARETEYLFNFFDDPVAIREMCTKALEAGIEVEYAQKIIRMRGLKPDKPPVEIENWPWPVKIYSLGKFGIVQEEKPARSSRKAQQRPLLLLKALIALGGREIEEERITSLVWPDADGDLAHLSFQSALHRLRKLLGCSEVLILRDGRLTLDDRVCWVDAWAFERLVGQAEQLGREGNNLRARQVMDKAIRLYRGSFLSGERDEPWVVSASERLKRKCVKAINWVGGMLEEEHCFQEALAYYEKSLEVDECWEQTYQRLMICHGELGQESEVLAVYRRCSKTLGSVLGIAPSARTEAIRDSFVRVSPKHS